MTRRFANNGVAIGIAVEQHITFGRYRHDATKELYQRKLRTGLTSDIFKKYFSLFCLVTYHDRRLEFSEADLHQYLTKSLKVEKAKVDNAKFVTDLTSAICVMQKDGTHYIFSHRSFQEYFVAYCLDRVVQKHAKRVLPQLGTRGADSVITMLYDMNDDLVENEYVLPYLNNLAEKAASWGKSQILESYLEYCGFRIGLDLEKDGSGGWSVDLQSEFGMQCRSIRKLYPGFFSPKGKGRDHEDFSVITRLFTDNDDNDGGAEIGLVRDSSGKLVFQVIEQRGTLVGLGSLDWIYDLATVKDCAEELRVFSEIRKKVAAKRRAKVETLDKLLE